MLCDLYTQAGEAMPENVWDVYPRPQMRRNSYVNLNGIWDFGVRKNRFPESYERAIRVPFCPESLLSGVQTHYPEGNALCYRRFFALPENFVQGRVLLHIGAADQQLQCYVNDQKVGGHTGGYTNMTFDITDALTDGENELKIRCFDDLDDQTMPYGKQSKKRGGMWHTPVSGIWQSVWMESVPEEYIQKLGVENRAGSVIISVEPPMDGTVTVPLLGEFPLVAGRCELTPKEPHLWCPEDPFLYEFTLEAGEDRVQSYFAIRTLDTRIVDGYPRLCLNGKPYFFHGLLDQGYWPDGLYTPADPVCYAEELLAMKALGFNTLRKHVKVEPEEFYYQCDKLGMIVFQDMVNNGDYNHLRDTVIPAAGVQKTDDRKMHRDEKTRKMFLENMEAVVEQLKNHPCIAYWTIFTEGRGQFCADTVCNRLCMRDDTRFIDAASGWFRQKNTDVDSRHVYFGPLHLTAEEKPLVLSEFGGLAYKPDGHMFHPDNTYGYGLCKTREEFARRLRKLYMEQVVPAVRRGLCAAIYAQVSDVEDEINGLLSYDRRVCKVTPEELLPIAEALRQAIE